MKSAPEFIREKERLQSLWDLKILDSLPENDFDSITILAAQICKTPVALICLVDQERIWFKSKYGLNAEQIPREAAFCSYTILQKESFVVKDMTSDMRFFDHPLVAKEPKFKFYAGVPLMSPDNFPIGTLCVLDSEVKDISDEKIRALKTLSNQVTRLLELKTQLTQMQIHEKRRLQYEQQIHESSRLSTLGEMAAGIAHEINNPLTIIQCKSKILKRKCEEGNFIPQDNIGEFETINKTVDRIVTIIKGLKTYSRNSENDPMKTTNLKMLIDETMSLFKERYKIDGVEVLIDCSPTVNISCRPSQISQVLLNLFSNSYDAICESAEKWIRLEVSEHADAYRIKMIDSGHGIPAQIAQKITQPFFTTKEVGKGTGLGLSISKAILDKHGGNLSYDAQEAHTTFVIIFPKDKILSKAC